MADNFTLLGTLATTPSVGAPSGFPSLTTPLDEQMVLSNLTPSKYTLTADSAQAVAFGGCTEANVVMVKTVGGHVAVRLTSADGTAQIVPVDGLMVFVNRSVPFTAITLTRDAGVETTVEVILGEKS